MSKTVDLLLKASKNDAVVLGANEKYLDPEFFPTKFPALNLILGGDPFEGGIPSGFTVFAGESKSFKTMLALLSAKAYLDAYDDAVVLFYDSEFGSTGSYWKSVGIDPEHVIHVPVSTVEELTTDFKQRWKAIEEHDLKVVVVLDSLSALVSSSEVENAISGEIKADPGRKAKLMKSFFMMNLVPVNMRKIPFISVAHVYDSIGQMYGEKKVSGGRGIIYSANNVVMVSASKWKEGSEQVGNEFLLTINKGRRVKQGSRVRIRIPFEGKINPITGMFWVLHDMGIIKSSGGPWYYLVFDKDRKFKRSDFEGDPEFALEILKLDYVREALQEHYQYKGDFSAA